jgi:hypothetical protein
MGREKSRREKSTLCIAEKIGYPSDIVAKGFAGLG